MFSESDLRAASAAGILDTAQLARLLEFLSQRVARDPSPAGPRFDVAHLLWYAGALIVIGAMGLFSTLAFSQMGGQALAITALVYAAVFWAGGHYLWHEKNLHTPGGLLIAIAVSMAPLAVYGIQDHLGWWGRFGKPGTVRDFYVWIKGSWIFMEVAAITVAALALRFYRFPFIVSIIALALWFMSMDLAPWIAGADYADWETRRRVSVWLGAAILAVAYGTDRMQRTGDFAFWLYLFGLLAFWGGITASSGGTAFEKALYCALNVGLLFGSVFLARRVFAVFGVIGVALYLGDLANKVFRDSLLFPFALSLIGVGVIAAGLLYYRNQDRIAAWFEVNLPKGVKRLRPQHAV
ncbi:MAG: hypothetical protein QOG38_3317 [Hyphomicrobiales bacterium]|nr:hypothetical protein [Hyphomicrobiales bacterium]